MKYLKDFSRGFFRSLAYGVGVGGILGFLNIFALIFSASGGSSFFLPISMFFLGLIPMIGIPILAIGAILGAVTGAILGLMYALSSENNTESHPWLLRLSYIALGVVYGLAAAVICTLMYGLPPIFMALGILATGIVSGTFTILKSCFINTCLTPMSSEPSSPPSNHDYEALDSDRGIQRIQLPPTNDATLVPQPLSRSISFETTNTPVNTVFFKPESLITKDNDSAISETSYKNGPN